MHPKASNLCEQDKPLKLFKTNVGCSNENNEMKLITKGSTLSFRAL